MVAENPFTFFILSSNRKVSEHLDYEVPAWSLNKQTSFTTNFFCLIYSIFLYCQPNNLRLQRGDRGGDETEVIMV